MDTRLRRKKQSRDTHLRGQYFKGFGEKVPAPGQSTETNPDTISTQRIKQDTESTVSSTPEEPTITQEPGTYQQFQYKNTSTAQLKR